MFKHLFFAVTASLMAMSSLSADLSYTSGHNNNQVTQTPVLYYSNNCPHCEKVIAYLTQSKQSAVRKNISSPVYRSELKGLGQKSVPVLVVGTKVIVGAGPITQYFRENKK